MCFVKLKDEDRPDDAAINLDLVQLARTGPEVLRLYFERGTTPPAKHEPFHASPDLARALRAG